MTRTMIDDASALTADLLRLAITIFLLVVAFKSGRWISDRTGKLWQGWVVGLSVFLVIGLAVSPALLSLKWVSCWAEPHQYRQSCFEGDPIGE